MEDPMNEEESNSGLPSLRGGGGPPQCESGPFEEEGDKMSPGILIK